MSWGLSYGGHIDDVEPAITAQVDNLKKQFSGETSQSEQALQHIELAAEMIKRLAETITNDDEKHNFSASISGHTDSNYFSFSASIGAHVKEH